MNSDNIIPHILIIYLSGSTHGNRDRLLNICKVWSSNGSQIGLLTSKVTQILLCKELGENREKVTFKVVPFSGSDPQTYIQIITAFLTRILLGSMVKIPKSVKVMYSMTGILPEVVPGFIFKIRNPDVKWVVSVDNLVARPGRRVRHFIIKLLAYLGFRITVRLIKRADLVFTSNQIVKNRLIELGLNLEKIKLTTYGVMFENIDRAQGSEIKKYGAVFLGRLHEEKGIFDLVKAWGIVCKEDSGRKLAIIGPGLPETVSKLRREISHNNLDSNIELTGPLNPMEKFEALKSSKIFLFPSYGQWEAWSIAVMEALACGLPVVSYDLPFYREIYPPGLLQTVPIRDFDELGNKVLMLLNDGGLRKKLVRWGKEYAKDFTWESVAQKEYSYMVRLLM